MSTFQTDSSTTRSSVSNYKPPTDSNSDLQSFYDEIDPMERLLIASVTSRWRGDAREGLSQREKNRNPHRAFSDLTVTVQLNRNADDQLELELKEVAAGGDCIKTDQGRFILSTRSNDFTVTSVRQVVQQFYERHGLPE